MNEIPLIVRKEEVEEIRLAQDQLDLICMSII